jgi:hypothetical protein
MAEAIYKNELDLFEKVLKAGNVEMSPAAWELMKRMCNRSAPDAGLGTQMRVFSEALYYIRGKITDNILDYKGTSGTLADRKPKQDDWVDGVDFMRRPAEIAVQEMPVFNVEDEVIELDEIEEVTLRLQELLPRLKAKDMLKSKRHQIDQATRDITRAINQIQCLEITPLEKIAQNFTDCAKGYQAAAEKYGDELGGVNLALMRDATNLCLLMATNAQACIAAYRANFPGIV